MQQVPLLENQHAACFWVDIEPILHVVGMESCSAAFKRVGRIAVAVCEVEVQSEKGRFISFGRSV